MAGTSGLDERFITTVNLEPYFVDKDTGVALINGSISFYQDISRTTPKLVYQLSGGPTTGSDYSYTPMSNPVTLSSVGTIESGGNNVALYYFPYQGTPEVGGSDGSIELYYVEVKDSLGVVQFTREAWPTLVGSQNPTAETGIQTNQISNSQFVDFDLFNDQLATITYSGVGTRNVQLTSDWVLSFNHTGSGSITVERTLISGSSNYPTNPPYWLQITPGVNLTGVKIVQRLEHNPAIWATTNDGIVSYISGGVLLDVGVSAGMYYVPSVSTPTEYELFNVTNGTGVQTYYTGTKEIALSTNTDTGANGYVDIEIRLSASAVSRVSSVQVVGSASEQEAVPYIQETANRQQDHTYHYYKDALAAKAIPSYLTGWDFPLNPAQFAGATQAASGAANTSKYVWDQTILFQSAASGFNVARTGTLGSIQLQNATGSDAQFALVQYLSQEQARALLRNYLSVQVAGNTNMAAGLGITVSLWYTVDANLPVIGSNASIVLTLDANGKPATKNGTWVEVAPSGDVAKFGTLAFGTDNEGAPLNFSFWDAPIDTAGSETATYFAIVVGSAAVTTTSVVTFKSISLVPGTIATAPAPQTKDEVLRECMYYYQKSYEAGTALATTTAPGYKLTYVPLAYDTGSALLVSFELSLKAIIRKMPTIVFYSYTLGTIANVTGFAVTTGGFAIVDKGNFLSSGWTQATVATGTNYVPFVINTINAYSQANMSSAYMSYHYVADARLGVLN